MKKNDLIQELVRCEGMDKDQAARVVSLVFNTVKAAVESREPVDIRGFGKWQVVKRPTQYAKLSGREFKRRTPVVKFIFKGKVVD